MPQPAAAASEAADTIVWGWPVGLPAPWFGGLPAAFMHGGAAGEKIFGYSHSSEHHVHISRLLQAAA